MELNLLIIAPLLLIKRNFIKEQASLVLKYFLVQVVGSIYLLIRLILLNFNYITINKLNLILIVALILKAGVPPLHF
jgi:formate hydrogenlyase subunit 3/multisubunit Na+/H+ antiporter MnhD subunit